MAADKALAKHAAKAKAQPVHRATALLHHAETGHRAGKAPRALKAKAMAAVKADATVAAMAVVVRSNVAIPVLTNAAMAKAVPHHAVLVRRDVARGVDHKAGTEAVMEAGTKAVKTVINMMATSCLATSIP